MKVDVFPTEWGWVGIGVTARGVTTAVLPRRSRRAVERELAGCARSHPVLASGSKGTGTDEAAATRHLEAARKAICSYLSGKRDMLDVTLDLDGHPIFRRKVWRLLQSIPYGRVRSYGWVARRIGKPRASRAVGGACGANPVPLLVPCHRVVGGDGSLGGFSGGLPAKKRLLRLEGVLRTMRVGKSKRIR